MQLSRTWSSNLWSRTQ